MLLERGAHSYVSTFDGNPYVAPFSGNIIELCPVGALTSRNYRFRARPWDIEDSGSVCTLCAAQCNVSLTVRDERVLRVLARDHPEVDDGWLCDRGRFAYPAAWRRPHHAADDPRRRRAACRVLGAGARRSRHTPEARRGADRGARRRRRHQRGGLPARSIVARGAGLAATSTRASRARCRWSCTGRWPSRGCRRRSQTWSSPTRCLRSSATSIHDAAILDLRLRKGVRRHGMKLVRASAADLLGERQMS